MKEALELYIHIPFCVKKCDYCDFLSAPAAAGQRQEYVESLCERIRNYGKLAKAYHIISIFLGGGTPSILEADQTGKIFRTIYDHFSVDEDAEITTEMNPGTVTREKLSAYRKFGINRLSIGLQSANNRELAILGRIHNYEDFLKTYQMARMEGFQNINVDLMSAIPEQTLASYEETLHKVAGLNPEHISAYSLILEEGTPFYEKYGGNSEAARTALPDEEVERRMYLRTKEILEEYGYHRYEISNYAKEGYECRHNLGYWDRVEYLGIGSGAASLFRHCRWKEAETLEQGIVEKEELSKQEEIEEFMFLGLRKMKGVSKNKFREVFGEELETYYQEVKERMIKEGLLLEKGEILCLTERGIDLSNYVLSQFLL